MTKPCDVALCNTSDDCSHGQWGNIVLKHLYQSLGDGNGGIEGCIREALIHYPKHNHTTTVMVGSSARTTYILLTQLILKYFWSLLFYVPSYFVCRKLLKLTKMDKNALCNLSHFLIEQRRKLMGMQMSCVMEVLVNHLTMV